MYSLIRERDGAGDSGPMSTAIFEQDGEVKFEEGARPRIGVCMRVGSYIARTMQWQDYWTTTLITAIERESEDEVVFRTGNSTYTWKQF